MPFRHPGQILETPPLGGVSHAMCSVTDSVSRAAARDLAWP